MADDNTLDNAGEVGRDLADSMAAKVTEVIDGFPAQSVAQRVAIARIAARNLETYADELAGQAPALPPNVRSTLAFDATGIEVCAMLNDDGQPTVLITTDSYTVPEQDGRPIVQVLLNDSTLYDEEVRA